MSGKSFAAWSAGCKRKVSLGKDLPALDFEGAEKLLGIGILKWLINPRANALLLTAYRMRDAGDERQQQQKLGDAQARKGFIANRSPCGENQGVSGCSSYRIAGVVETRTAINLRLREALSRYPLVDSVSRGIDIKQRGEDPWPKQ
jgi:hypothetical protein